MDSHAQVRNRLIGVWVARRLESVSFDRCHAGAYGVNISSREWAIPVA